MTRRSGALLPRLSRRSASRTLCHVITDPLLFFLFFILSSSSREIPGYSNGLGEKKTDGDSRGENRRDYESWLSQANVADQVAKYAVFFAVQHAAEAAVLRGKSPEDAPPDADRSRRGFSKRISNRVVTRRNHDFRETDCYRAPQNRVFSALERYRPVFSATFVDRTSRDSVDENPLSRDFIHRSDLLREIANSCVRFFPNFSP